MSENLDVRQLPSFKQQSSAFTEKTLFSAKEEEARMKFISIFTLKYKLPAQNATMHSTSVSIQSGFYPSSHSPCTPSPSIRPAPPSGQESGEADSQYLDTLSYHLEVLNIKDSPNHQQHPPTPPSTIPVSLPHPQYPYHIYICSPPHSP